ncbi:MAG: DNA polymerase III subunit beta [Clostridia bacterium]|nr:DNA polymerase III subunit beta [Clostridia bacterium]
MKIVFNKNELCTAVAPLMSGVSSKMTLPAAEGILIEATAPDTCVMTTFDLEKGVRITVKADVIEEGSAIINATKFNQTIRAMDGADITLTVDSRMKVGIQSGKASHTMSALPGSDFPEIPRLTSQNGFIANLGVFKSMISKCTFAMGVNDQRPVLNGMYFTVNGNELSLVSCDSFKMAVCSTQTELKNLNDGSDGLDFKFILPNKSVTELYKLLDGDDEATVTIFMNRKNIIFSFGDILFFSKLIEGEYINYDRIIVRNHKIGVYVDKDALVSALERSALITEEKVAGSVRPHVKVEVSGSILKVSATSGIGSAYDELLVDHEGDDIVIAFNNRYLMDTLRACTADRVKLSLSSPLTSMNIEPDEDSGDDKELFMLLPVRMKD